MNYRHLLVLGTFLFVSIHAFSQKPIYDQIQTHSKNQYKPYRLFQKTPQYLRNQDLVIESLSHCDFLSLDPVQISELQNQSEDRIQIPLSFRDETLNVQLMKAPVLSEAFVINTSSGQFLQTDKRLYYWGIVEGKKNSLVALSIYGDQVSAIIANGNQVLNLVKHTQEDQYLLFEQQDLLIDNPFDCFVDEAVHTIHSNTPGVRTNLAGPDNCVNVYVEVDNDLVNQQGGAQAAADYVLGAFSQVAILYANEAINMTISEIFVWDGNDPYAGPSTNNYLDQFRSQLGGQFNGDIAHLVGTQGGGGIAYVDVLCNKNFAVAYSDLNNSYNDFPVYSWTVMVLTHEMGHNLGSPHTHSCAWNGNNTAIDGCGTSLGYSGCPGEIPDAGTIMSYCHLISGVGIDFNLGFGPQPGDLIRSEVYNASCLGACSEPVALDASIINVIAPLGSICGTTETPVVTLSNFGTTTLNSATIQYAIDGGTVNSFSWTGNLSNSQSEDVALQDITITQGSHTFAVTVTNPNGGSDENPNNDSRTSTYSGTQPSTFYADNDGDGFGDPNNSIQDCTPPTGYVTDNTDCDDTDNQVYPGAPCDDSNACTVGDILDSDCNCAGVFEDSDGDGVCDADDVCPGGDDNIDVNGDGTPDFCECTAATTSFPGNGVNHQGSGSSTVSVGLEVDSKNAIFTISGLGSRANGNPSQRFTDEVTVTYVDGNDSEQTYGTFSGANLSSVDVFIQDIVNSISVELRDGYDGDAPNISITLSDVEYCTSGVGCPDSDGDGVCDANDVCPGGDDNVDTDGDGIPDDCDTGCNNEITTSFNPASLQHSGSGSTSSILTFPSGNVNAEFSITGINAKLNGNSQRRYEEAVEVYYDNGTGEQLFGTYRGSEVNSVNISIPGMVDLIRVSLSDVYNGGANNQDLSVQLGDVTSCIENAATFENPMEGVILMTVAPNPSEGRFMIRFNDLIETGEIRILNVLGEMVKVQPLRQSLATRIDLSEMGDGMYLISLHVDSKSVETQRLIIH